MTTKPPGDELSALLDSYQGKSGGPTGSTPKVSPEDAWVAKFNEHKAKVIRPTLEALGKEIESRGHDFLIAERDFRRGNRAIPDEGYVRIDIYLADEKTRTKINADRRPGLSFQTHVKTQMIAVTICDITSRGGVESKIGEFPIEKVDVAFIRDKFVALFKRLLSK
jgi:hypothetical protein